LYGRKYFISRTDHKSLISIFGECKRILPITSYRLQRYSIFLSGYSFTIQFIKGLDNGNSYELSRLTLIKFDRINLEDCDTFFIDY